ncbi:hypothetical protein Adt_38274 [Abeliophyllum distichum]|uniref:Uncharacterized protein n=1 Tax=Abeliophyllum distichum TaxID=126358 RepID=A0ABD1Q3F1_9LAMI
MDMATLWKANPKSAGIRTTNGLLWKTVSKTREISSANSNKSKKLRKCISLRVATSFTRVCLCAPISSYIDMFQDEAPSRRSYSYSRSNPFLASSQERTPNVRMSVKGRKIFRGKSLTDDVLMKRLVIEEGVMQVRRRNEMEIIKRRSVMRKKKLGPSPLRRMVLAKE